MPRTCQKHQRLWRGLPGILQPTFSHENQRCFVETESSRCMILASKTTDRNEKKNKKKRKVCCHDQSELQWGNGAANELALTGWPEKGSSANWETKNSKGAKNMLCCTSMQQSAAPREGCVCVSTAQALPSMNTAAWRLTLCRRRVLNPSWKLLSWEIPLTRGKYALGSWTCVTSCRLQCWVIHLPGTQPGLCKAAETEHGKNADGCKKAQWGKLQDFI